MENPGDKALRFLGVLPALPAFEDVDPVFLKGYVDMQPAPTRVAERLGRKEANSPLLAAIVLITILTVERLSAARSAPLYSKSISF